MPLSGKPSACRSRSCLAGSMADLYRRNAPCRSSEPPAAQSLVSTCGPMIGAKSGPNWPTSKKKSHFPAPIARPPLSIPHTRHRRIQRRWKRQQLFNLEPEMKPSKPLAWRRRAAAVRSAAAFDAWRTSKLFVVGREVSPSDELVRASQALKARILGAAPTGQFRSGRSAAP